MKPFNTIKSLLKKLGAYNFIIVLSLFHMKMSGKLRTEAGADETSILTVVFLGDIAHQLFYNCSRTVIQQKWGGKKMDGNPGIHYYVKRYRFILLV